MAIIRILQYPDPKLKRVSKPVEDFGDDIQKVIDDMFETHYNTPNCAALAATQLDLETAWRITVIDFSEKKDEPLCLVNPEIVERDGEQITLEGCMSVCPDYVHERVKRAQKIKVKAQDRHGKAFEMVAEDFMAKCIQHEIDHLDGFIYLDRIPRMKRDRVDKKITKVQRMRKKQKNQPQAEE